MSSSSQKEMNLAKRFHEYLEKQQKQINNNLAHDSFITTKNGEALLSAF